MGNPYYQHDETRIVNPAHDAVSSDPVPPESHFVSRQWFAKISRVVVSRNALFEKSHHAPLGGPVQLPEFT